MCGIFGIIRRGGLRPEDSETLRRLARALEHRGPDGEGFHEDGPVGLGMRRLAIIDLTGGWQPLFNEDHSIALVANGEVYNFIELRRDLERRGHRFRTGSDCENIAHLYEDRGADCVHAMRGMFAFALHDRTNGKVVLGRDRMGEKPLYLVERDGFLAFASELGALVEAGVVPFEPDPEAIELFYHYELVPEPRCAVKGVRKLPAGHLLEISLDPWRLTERRYWRMDDSPEIHGDPATTIRGVLEEIGELIIRSDVPVGVALSGGIDSSAICCLAAKRYAGQIQAFTIGYPGTPWQDERHLAKELTDQLKIELHTLELGVDQVVEQFPNVCFRRDDPVADGSGSSYFAVMELARSKGVPVMLMGQGGDELFWGYPWCRRAVHESERRRALQAGQVGLGSYLSMRKPPLSYNGGLRWLADGGGLLEGFRRWQEDRHRHPDEIVFYDRTRSFHDAERWFRRIAGSSVHPSPDGELSRALFRGTELWDRIDLSITRLICDIYLLSNGINQGDRLSMATSVECRLPFVDYRLVETVIGLRKVHTDLNEPPKAWLRAALAHLVPPFVFARRKRGFTPPWRVWTKAAFARYGGDLAEGVLVRRGLLNQRGAALLSSGLDIGSRPRPLAWPTLVLEQWCRGMEAAVVRGRLPLAHREAASATVKT